MKTLGTWVTLAIALGAGGGEAAEREVRSGLGAQLNPAGLRFELGVAWRWRLFSSTSALLDGAHVALGVTNQLSPAYNRLEGWVEISPLSILDFRAGAEGVGYFGTFGSLVGFPSYDSDFSDDAREAIEDQAVARIGRRFYVPPRSQVPGGAAQLPGRRRLRVVEGPRGSP